MTWSNFQIANDLYTNYKYLIYLYYAVLLYIYYKSFACLYDHQLSVAYVILINVMQATQKSCFRKRSNFSGLCIETIDVVNVNTNVFISHTKVSVSLNIAFDYIQIHSKLSKYRSILSIVLIHLQWLPFFQFFLIVFWKAFTCLGQIFVPVRVELCCFAYALLFYWESIQCWGYSFVLAICSFTRIHNLYTVNGIRDISLS